MEKAPTSSADFDRAYRLPITFWGDIRVPAEIKELAQTGNPASSLEFGCGIGRLTSYMARQGLKATGIDFSSVAVEKARTRIGPENLSADFLVGDVTHLDKLKGQFDISFDVGCFHCLDAGGQQKYVAEALRLLKPGGVHMIWALDSPPSDIPFSPEAIGKIFAPGFALQKAEKSRRRIVSSHWYWLIRSHKAMD